MTEVRALAVPYGHTCAALVAAFGAGWLLALSGLLVSPASAAGPGCPAPPYSASKLASVPEAQRAACFGRTEITFVATGGPLNGVWPGVEIDPGFGRPTWFAEGQEPQEPWSFVGWKPSDLVLAPAAQAAFDSTSPCCETGALTQLPWWRVRGHFDDPASSGCRSFGDPQYPYTVAEAIEFCRNLFFIDALTWLRTPPTDMAPVGADPANDQRPLGLMVLSAVMLAAALVASLVLERRRSPARPGPPG